ncbi:MAG TPA: hypothetical protein VHT26_18765 [Trebonia sp.]|nr:hypothetical protein [Trebonia sp.]
MRAPAMVAVVALASAVTACTSASGHAAHAGASAGGPSVSSAATPTASQAELRRQAEAPALISQCALDRGIVRAALPSSLGHDGKIKPGIGDTPTFVGWYDNVSSVMVDNQLLFAWTAWAVANAKLPPAVCGTSASAIQLASQLFPGWPTVWAA